ncbi:MAG: hypothetical protein OSA48_10690, partial [Akkermansiaceae bacterium]|nr:hypothetical protein [Akkermansiaceae bacterium]
MKLSKLISVSFLAFAGVASGQSLYGILHDDDPGDAVPVHWTAAFNVGYDDNPSPSLSEIPGFDSEGTTYLSASIQGDFASKTARTTIDAWARLGIIYYVDEIQQRLLSGVPVGTSDDTFYTTTAGLNITHHVSERLRLLSRTNISWEQEPDYDTGIATDRRQGQYVRYNTDNSVGFSWNERVGTVTGYRFSGTTWDDIINQDTSQHLFYNQFRYRTSENTVLTSSVRYGFTDNDGGDSDSLYLLVGIEHEFSPTTVAVLRVGGQHYSPDGGSDQWSPFVEGTIKTQVNAQFGVRAFVHYGVEDRNRNISIHDADAFPDASGNGPTASFAPAGYNERNILRIGTKASYVVSEKLTLFGGTNLVFENYENGAYTLAGFNSGGPWASGDPAPDFDQSIANVNIGA